MWAGKSSSQWAGAVGVPDCDAPLDAKSILLKAAGAIGCLVWSVSWIASPDRDIGRKRLDIYTDAIPSLQILR